MYKPMLTSGRDALRQFDPVKQFDWREHHMQSGIAARQRGIATDAAGSSGFAFLQASLELINPRLVEPLQATYHERDLPMKLGGGYPEFTAAWASNYASTGGGFYGLMGTNNNDVPIAQADVEKGTWPTFNWNQGFFISFVDLKRMEFAKANGNQPPFTLQKLYEDSVRTVWDKCLEQLAYLGFMGNPGLINNPAVSATVVGKGAALSTLWSQKTANEILNDINFGITQAVSASGFDIVRGCPDTLLLPFTQFNMLTNTMAVGTTNSAISILEYVKRNCAATEYFGGDAKRFNIYPLPNPFISGQGIGNTAAQNAQGNGLDRAVFYRNDEASLVLPVPTVMQPAMTVPSEKVGYSTFFSGCLGVVNFLRASTLSYEDGI